LKELKIFLAFEHTDIHFSFLMEYATGVCE